MTRPLRHPLVSLGLAAVVAAATLATPAAHAQVTPPTTPTTGVPRPEAADGRVHSMTGAFTSTFELGGECTVKNGPGISDDQAGEMLRLDPTFVPITMHGDGASYIGDVNIHWLDICAVLDGPVSRGEVYGGHFGTYQGSSGVDPLTPWPLCAIGRLTGGAVDVYGIPLLGSAIPVGFSGTFGAEWEVLSGAHGFCFEDDMDVVGRGSTEVSIVGAGVPFLSLHGVIAGGEQHAADVDTVDMSPCTVTLVEDAFFDLKRSPSGARDTSLCAIAKWPVRQGVRVTVKG